MTGPVKLPLTTPLPTGMAGFVAGFSAFAVGVKLVLPGGGMFRHALAPVLLSAVVLTAVAIGAFFGAKFWLVEWFEESWIGWLGGVLAFLLTLVISYFLFMPVMSIFAPLFIDPICEKVHLKYSGKEFLGERSAQAFLKRQFFAFLQALKWTLIVLLVQIPLALLSLLTVVVAVVAVPVSAMIQGADLMDNALSMRDYGLRRKLGWVRRYRWAAAGLGAGAGLLMLVPGLNLFVMPAGAAGATMLMIAADGGETEELAEHM